MKPASMWPAAIATFVASIMVASTVLAIYTTLHLRDTTRKVNNQAKVIHEQQQRINLLVDVSNTQHDLTSAQQNVIQAMINNEKKLLKIFVKKPSRAITVVKR